MAHAATLGALTEELVELITSTSSKTDRNRFSLYRESSTRNLRYHNFLRTNQFEVENRLVGLEERFSVHHRDGLAHALRQSLDTLAPLRTKWSPDILHFLLELADQPAQKTDLYDVALLKQPKEGDGPPLKWEDIAREDGWHREPDLWRSIDCHDSSDEEYQEDKPGADHDSDDTSISTSEALAGRRPEDFQVDTSDDAALKEVQQSQSWRAPDVQQPAAPSRKLAVSEFQMIREVLFMLQGLETSLFQKQGQPDPTYQVANMAWETCKALIGWFAEAGRRLSILRSFACRRQTTPLLQVFHANVVTSLQSFDKEISLIQHGLISPQQDTVVSSIALQRELGPHLEPLNALSDIVRQLEEAPQVGAFRYLELLYREVGAAQAAGKTRTYEFLGHMFFDCFQMYLRPIRLWMREGELLPADKIFFVADSVSQVPLNQIWQEQFKLRRTSDGKLHVPNFLEPSAAKIFTAGKSIVVLKHLGKYESTRAQWNRPEPLLTFDAVCPEGVDFAPFNELFSFAFGSWIQSKHHATSEALKQVLFESCDLWSNIDAIESLYFMSDGFVADAFAQNLFARIDSAKTDWHDRYLLTGLAQEAFSSRVDAQRLSVTVDADGQKAPIVCSRDSVRKLLPTLVVSYRFAWPIQLIITSECLARYQAVFTFLLQIRRGVKLLGKNRSRDSYVADQEDWEVHATYYRLRSKMLWFCNCVQTYLSTLVLAPCMARLREQLREAHDVDAMIAVHLAVTRQAINAACLGSKLSPIRETILDVLDLAIKLERAERFKAAREAEEMQELSRLSVMSSPLPQQRGGTPKRARPARWVQDSDDEKDEDEEKHNRHRHDPAAEFSGHQDETYGEVLAVISGDLERHIRFICGGLRGVARASSDEAAAKWEMLAEMLESGVGGEL
ncbi:hypothetical protein ACHAQH_000395 [Verticillium albo-atrum]